jgi:hypothetical protein
MAISAPFCRFATPRLAAQAQIGGSSVAKSAPAHANDLAVAHQELRFFDMRRLATLFDFRPAAILPRNCKSFGHCRRSGSGFSREQFLEQSLGSLQSFIRQDDRFGAPGGVGDHPLLVQPIHRIPGERLPNAVAIVPPEQEQREHAVIDSVSVDCHGDAVPSSWEKRRPRCGSPLSHIKYQAP